MILEHNCFDLDLVTVFMDVNLDPDLGADGVVGFQNNFDGRGFRAYFLTLVF